MDRDENVRRDTDVGRDRDGSRDADGSNVHTDWGRDMDGDGQRDNNRGTDGDEDVDRVKSRTNLLIGLGSAFEWTGDYGWDGPTWTISRNSVHKSELVALALVLKRVLPTRELMQQHAERPPVRCGPLHLSPDHLGRHVRQRAAERAAPPLVRLGEAEVHQAGVAVIEHTDVLGGKVAIEVHAALKQAECLHAARAKEADLLVAESWR